MKEEQEGKRKNQTLNLSKLATTVLFLSSVIIVACVLQSTLLSTTISIATKPAFAQQQQKPTEIISTVKVLLNQTINEYRNQNFTAAQSLASSAYLDHFEFIEAPLEKHDKALKNETEIMLREQLRQSIKDKLPVQDIQQLINKINNNLIKAEQLLAQTEPSVKTTADTKESAAQTKLNNSSSSNTTRMPGTLQSSSSSSTSALNTTNKILIAGDESDKPYMPRSITIKTGDKVGWINTDEEIHTVTSGFENSTDKGKLFDSGFLKTNQTFEHTFDKAGMYNYFCTVHPTMTGVVNVK
jgi:plastocyanin